MWATWAKLSKDVRICPWKMLTYLENCNLEKEEEGWTMSLQRNEFQNKSFAAFQTLTVSIKFNFLTI